MLLIILTLPLKNKLEFDAKYYFRHVSLNDMHHFLTASLVFLLLMCPLCDTLAFQKELRYSDHCYESAIRTVQVFPLGNNIQSTIAPAVKRMDDARRLILMFDDLREDADYYHVKFIHCNADWTPSDLRSNNYVEGFNEFEIEDFRFSAETKTNYVHYQFTLPSFKISGNYLAVVYRDRNPDDLILTKRFMVYDGRAVVGLRVDRSNVVANRNSHQRVEVTMNYANLNSVDPGRDFKVVVRQNQRWDNMKYNLKPTFVDDNSKIIRYQNMGDVNDFWAANEFRFFDMRTVNFKGRNIASIEQDKKRIMVNLGTDRMRTSGYLQNLDLNGKYFIEDREANNGNTSITAEYANVLFQLEYPKSKQDIYVLGDFNNWELNPSSRMTYNKKTERYEISYLLKQGWYDYLYWVDDPITPYALENSFFDTENFYEVFVYFKGIGSRGDELVGYSKVNFNNRRN